ncbi:MAG: DNA alkylation repair protein [archaeon]|nr:DNA alkylation repair protein [archaeon]MDA1131383.1 DNA alkylation repair protein [archaeon]
MKFLRLAYAKGCIGLMVKPTSDLLAYDAGFSFNLGCADPELRRIASWVLTNSKNRRKLARLIPALWKRHGYEDLKMAGILLSNLSKDDLGEDPWMAFIHLLQKQESLDMILDISEEIIRGGSPVPNDTWIVEMSKQSKLWHQTAVIFCSLSKRNSTTCKQMIELAPTGGELFERIRIRALAEQN